MKKPRRPIPRPATALILTAVAIFILFGDRCGLLGQLTTEGLQRLLGAPGTGLLVCTLVAVVFVLAFPGRVGAWLMAKAIPVAVVVQPPPLPANTNAKERRARDDVRTALKELGFLKHEIEPVLAGLDPKLSFEAAVKAALRQLNN